MNPFEVNGPLMDVISNHEEELYDRFSVTFVSKLGRTQTRTGTITDLLSYILPTDKIVKVSRA